MRNNIAQCHLKNTIKINFSYQNRILLIIVLIVNIIVNINCDQIFGNSLYKENYSFLQSNRKVKFNQNPTAQNILTKLADNPLQNQQIQSIQESKLNLSAKQKTFVQNIQQLDALQKNSQLTDQTKNSKQIATSQNKNTLYDESRNQQYDLNKNKFNQFSNEANKFDKIVSNDIQNKNKNIQINTNNNKVIDLSISKNNELLKNETINKQVQLQQNNKINSSQNLNQSVNLQIQTFQKNKNQQNIHQQNNSNQSLINFIKHKQFTNLLQNNSTTLPIPNYNQVLIPNSQTLQLSTFHHQQIYQNNKFQGLLLSHQIPLKFYQKQIFQIKGKLNNISTINGINLNFILRKIQSGQRYSYSYFVKPSTQLFNFKLKFNNLKGKFYLAFFAGPQGSIKNQIYEIYQQLINPISTVANNLQSQSSLSLVSNQYKQFLIQKANKPTGLAITFINNKVGFYWQSNYNHPLHRLIISQNQKNVSYFLSNFQTQFQIDEADFSEFNSQQVLVSLQAAHSKYISYINQSSLFSQKQIIKFNACQHHFSQQDYNYVALNNFKQKINVNQPFKIEGIAFKQLQNKFWILNPNKTFFIDYLNYNKAQKKINQGIRIDKIITFTQPGVYIFEINKPQGGAALNRPIYVGEFYPILPDIFDLSENQFVWKSKNLKIHSQVKQNKVQILINLINSKRKQFGSDPIFIDQQLNILAQNHSNDMVQKHYFNHVNLQKKTPQDRAHLAGINTKIRQNIAMNLNFTQAHYKLCRSPIHLQNIVNPEWQTVGLGLAVNQFGVQHIVQQFSIRNLLLHPLSEQQQKHNFKQMIQIVKQQNPEIKDQNKELSKIMRRQMVELKTPLNQLGFKLTGMGFSKFSLGSIKLFYSKFLLQKLKGKNYFKLKGKEYEQIALTFLYLEQDYIIISFIFI